MYTFIAYKTESDDCRKGHVVESYPSDFVYDNNQSRDHVVKLLDHYVNVELDYAEEGYVVIVLFCGIEIINKNFGEDYVVTERVGFRELANSILREVSNE